MKHNQQLGAWGEAATASYLVGRGYEIVARNVRTPHGELDIVANFNGLTVFVEVKTRATGSLGPPEISISARKRAHLVAAAQYWAAQNEIDHWQIDAISVEGQPGLRPAIHHFENAVLD